MALAKCARCDKLFDKIRSPVCPRCQDAEDADFDKVRKVMNGKPDLNAEQVAELAQVELSCVLRMLEEGLITNVALGQSVKCGRCGAPAISVSKRLCQACLEKLNVEVARAQSQIKLDAKRQVRLGGQSGMIRKVMEDKRRVE